MSKSSKPNSPGEERNLCIKRSKASNLPPTVTDLTVKQLDITRLDTLSKSNRSTVAFNKHAKSRIQSPIASESSQLIQISTPNNSESLSKGGKDLPLSSAHSSSIPMKTYLEPSKIMIQTKPPKKDVAKMRIRSDDRAEHQGKETKFEIVEHTSALNSLDEIAKPSITLHLIAENIEKQTKNDVINKLRSISETKNDFNIGECFEEYQEEIIKVYNSGENLEREYPGVLKFDSNESVNEIEGKRQLIHVTEKAPESDEGSIGLNVVESTTSEIPPIKEAQSLAPKGDKIEDEGQHNVSVISYDSNIMLKDVKIKLNDCLRENSKIFDVTEPNNSISEAFKDLSFGRKLRGIACRNSINRLKHITVRERLASPSDSLFVNSSNMSFILNESRYTLEKPFCQDESHRNRKRKIAPDSSISTKKLKTIEYNLLYTSLEYLKNLKRHIRLPTVNASKYQFDLRGKSSVNNDTILMEKVNEPKKWCVVM